jgi:hypothetical protein
VEKHVYLQTVISGRASLACSLSFLNLIAIGKSILVARLNKKEGQITKIKKSHLKLLDQLELNVGDIVLSTKPSLN